MKKSSILKWIGFGLLAVVLAGAGAFVFRANNSSSRIVLADEIKEHRQLLHNGTGDHGCDCFSPLVTGFTVSNVTSTSVTCTWVCSSPSTYQVNYGTTNAHGTLFPAATPTLGQTSSSVTVTGLKASTAYHFGFISICLSNCTRNSSAGLKRTYQVGGQSDWTATTMAATGVLEENEPSASCAISGVAVAKVTAKDVTITWNTNTPATSLVEYGLTSEYGMKSGVNTIMEKNHSLQLFDLRTGATYHYRAVSYGNLGKTAYSSDLTFKTPAFEERVVDKGNIFNEPNPCSKWTMFSYFLYQPAKKVTIDILTLSGRLVASLESPSSSMDEGWNKVRWDNMVDNNGKALINGVYVYRMKIQTLTNFEQEVERASLRVVR